ncbi:hypothetical protein [Streptacidiphilus melanogenes]|uniref:hypothetical protein n=1 Tax=Streptacidiphilus melanogenes TaxID=411235 RepID=UPI0005AA09B4|nr:hypothetical protein [Streptacidiphilus melanogenes]
MTDILDVPEVTGFDRIPVAIGNSTLFAALDTWAPAEPDGHDVTEVTFTWTGVGDLEVPLAQADGMVAALRDWVDRIAAAVDRARMGAAQ